MQNVAHEISGSRAASPAGAHDNLAFFYKCKHARQGVFDRFGAAIINITSKSNGIGDITPARCTRFFKLTQQESLVGCIWKKHLDCFDVCSRHGEDMCRAFDERAGQWLAPEVANFGPFLHANLNRMRAGRLSSHGVHSGGSHFNVLAISQETAKKTFRNGTATNITGTNEEDAFHKMRPREP